MLFFHLPLSQFVFRFKLFFPVGGPRPGFRFKHEISVLAFCLSVTGAVSFSHIEIFNPTAGSHPWFQLPLPQISAPLDFGSVRVDSVLSFWFAATGSAVGAFCSCALVVLAQAACFPSVSCSLAIAGSFRLSSSVLLPCGSCYGVQCRI
jgi:hypothetical protein